MKIDKPGQVFIPVKTDATGSTKLARGAGKENPELWKASQDFESLFMSQLLRAMQKTLPENSLAKDGMSSYLFDKVMGEALAKNGGMGLADMLYRDMQAKGISDSAEIDSMVPETERIPPGNGKDNDVDASK
ncbi:MAG: rod-binding protein [Candidatus Marinimicrobia bacterium]|nr:rod-binding protein [Candidatus Neomarinimicrobiota bacterium]